MLSGVALAACGQSMDHGSTGAMDMSGAQSAKATLVPTNAPTGAGTATVAVVKGQVHVDVRAQQLDANATFTAHLHNGSCLQAGRILKTVGDLRTDATGAGMVHLEYAGSQVPMPTFVEVHANDGREGPVICGELNKT